mgnify:FL=1
MRNFYKIIILIFFLGFILNGCAFFVTEDDFGKSWTGHPYSQLKNQWGEPTNIVKNKDGTMEVRYDIFNGECSYFFLVDQNGQIIGYHYKSSGFGACNPIG